MSDRRQLRSPPAAMPIFRIVSLLIMLAVIGLTVYNLRQRATVDAPIATEPAVGKTPSAGEAFSQQPGASSSTATPPKSRKPAPDENAEQWKQFRRRSEAILDKSTSIRGYEMPAYWRVLDWVESQSLADFRARSLPQLPFQDYIQHPDKYRGRPVRVALEVRQVTSFEVDDTKGKRRKLYELWGVPTELDGWWYVVVTPELPPGFPMGKNLGATTTVYGYFFKLQGYHQLDAKINSRPLVAPMIIGRVAPVTVIAPAAPWNPLSGIVLVVGGVILVATIAGWFIAARRRPAARRASSFDLPDAMDGATFDGDAPTGVENE